jgi:hypothetical protein
LQSIFLFTPIVNIQCLIKYTFSDAAIARVQFLPMNGLMYDFFFMIQSFVLTFLAEWGDRSQIATIAVCLISLSKPTSQMCPSPIISILTCCMFQNAAGYAQECCGCCRRSNVGAHHLHVVRSGWRQHAGVEDISGHSSHHWRPPLPWLLCIIILLPAIVTTPLSFLLQFFGLLKITLPNPLSPRPIYQHMMLGIQIFCCTTIH